MERTELREQFFAEAMRDPYAHMVAHLAAEAWCEGYEQALRDAANALAEPSTPDAANALGEDGVPLRVPQVLVDMRYGTSRGERHNEALMHMTEERHKSSAQALLAIAALGPLVQTRPPEA